MSSNDYPKVYSIGTYSDTNRRFYIEGDQNHVGVNVFPDSNYSLYVGQHSSGGSIKTDGEVEVGGNTTINNGSLTINNAPVDTSVDNRTGTTTHTDFNQSIIFSNDNYRNYYIGIFGDSTDNDNVLAFCSSGGGDPNPNILFTMDANGSVAMTDLQVTEKTTLGSTNNTGIDYVASIVTDGDSTSADTGSGKLVIMDDSNTNNMLLKMGVNTSDQYSFIQCTKSGIEHKSIAMNVQGGNVGIGLTNPSYKLEVNGTTKISGNTTIGGTLNVTGNTTLTNPLYCYSNLFVYGDRIKIEGNHFQIWDVNIGGSSNTNGRAMLHRGDGTLTNAGSFLHINYSEDFGGGVIIEGLVDLTDELNVTGDATFGSTSNDYTINVGKDNQSKKSMIKFNGGRATFGYDDNESFIYAGSGKDIVFRLSSSGHDATSDYINAMIIEQTTGNIGIGTTNPSETLDVNGTATISNSLTIGGTPSSITGGNYSAAVTSVTPSNGANDPVFVAHTDNDGDNDEVARFWCGSTSLTMMHLMGIYHKRGTSDVAMMITSSNKPRFGNHTRGDYFEFAANSTGGATLNCDLTVEGDLTFSQGYNNSYVFRRNGSSNNAELYVGSSSARYFYFQKYNGYMTKVYAQSFGNFTGIHKVYTNDDVLYDSNKIRIENNDENDDIDEYNEEYIHAGYIVETTGEYKESISVSNTLPYVKLSSTNKSKSVFGVITSDIEAKNTYLTCNSVGEGAVMVCDYNGNIENGDYITTCVIKGMGCLQDDDILHNYTCAKSTQSIDFNDDTIDFTYFNSNSEKITKEEYDESSCYKATLIGAILCVKY